jgi:outer membrane receptor protein involved in Fe transport
VIEKEHSMNPSASLPLKILSLILLVFGFCLNPHSSFSQEQAAEKTKKEKEQGQAARITEEILVVGKAPRDIPLATVTTIEFRTIQLIKPRDLSEAIKYAPGVMVTIGSKDEYTLKLRGIDSKRIALLVDGVPVVEPYYGSFDLKTISAGGIQSLQITKGPSSVLYGPNTLGGIVNVITRRPDPAPKLSLNLSLGNRNTRSGGTDASYQWNKIGLVASALFQDSDGYRYTDSSGVRQERSNSDYQRFNLNGKLIYNPSSRSELIVDAGYYHSAYGIPPDLFGRPRYWRFPKWDRTSINAGGYTAIGKKSVLRFRGFFVNYYNTLDQFTNSSMTTRQFESTFDNSVYGFFGLGDFALAGWNSLKVSLYHQGDEARQQDDVGLPWLEYTQNTFSVGVEDHFSLIDKWTLIAGASIDTLDKFVGGTTTKANPLMGVKYSPSDVLDIHVSFAGKSKFPSMRSMYSSSNGNPDLKSEYGRSFELSATYKKGIFIAGSVFSNILRNYIDTVSLPDGTRRFINIGKARINGAELQAQQTWTWPGGTLEATVNYTFLDHKNETANRPLDVLPKHNLNFDLSLMPLQGLRLSLFGLFASDSWWYDTNRSTLLTIPHYISLDAVLSYALAHVEPFIRITNIFNRYFYTEPGFPWRGRFLEVGFQAGLL